MLELLAKTLWLYKCVRSVLTRLYSWQTQTRHSNDRCRQRAAAPAEREGGSANQSHVCVASAALNSCSHAEDCTHKCLVKQHRYQSAVNTDNYQPDADAEFMNISQGHGLLEL